jgi:hypothetical protein
MCRCIQLINDKLSEEYPEWNTELDIPITWGASGLDTSKVAVATRKKDERLRIKPKKIFASFCPFCGEKYQKEGG